MTFNPDLLTALLMLVGTPVMGKLNQKLVDVLKRFNVFANSKPETKRALALIGAAAISWITTTFGAQAGAIFSGVDVTALGVNDVVKVLLGLFVWLSSMYFHDTKPATPTAPAA